MNFTIYRCPKCGMVIRVDLNVAESHSTIYCPKCEIPLILDPTPETSSKVKMPKVKKPKKKRGRPKKKRK